MKKCTKCGKLTDNFGPDKKTKDSLSSWCRDCYNKAMKARVRTREGLVTKIWGSQRRHSKKRGHVMPDYTLKELQEWVFSQNNFEELYKNWEVSDYNRMLVPSCDRLDDSKHYTLDNLQLITWKENDDKRAKDMRACKLKTAKPHKPVIQMDLVGNVIAEFVSTAQASRRTRVAQQNISSVACNGRRKTAGGYLWKYKLLNNNYEKLLHKP